MNQIENVQLPTQQLQPSKLINAPRGSLFYEPGGRISLRADKGAGLGIEQRFAVSPFDWKIDLLEQSDLDQREGVMLSGLAFRVDPSSVKVTRPGTDRPGDLVISGAMVIVMALRPDGTTIPLTLHASLDDAQPLSYSDWTMGVMSSEGAFTALFRQLSFDDQ